MTIVITVKNHRCTKMELIILCGFSNLISAFKVGYYNWLHYIDKKLKLKKINSFVQWQIQEVS